MSDMSISGEDTKTHTIKTKAIVIIFVVLCIMFLTELILYKFALPSMKRPKIILSGADRISEARAAELLSPVKNDTWFSFDVEKAANIISSLPIMESVSVSKRFPDTVYISVTERESVALTFAEINGKSRALSIDRNGVLFYDSNLEKKSSSLPIVSGIPIEHLSEGMRIPAKYRTLIEQISDIKNIDEKYFASLAEICVVPKEYGNYELMLIPAKTRTRVLTDRALNEDALQYMMVVLDVVSSIEPNVSLIDLRYGSVSYRTR